MTTAKLLSAALIAVAALATPAMAREAHVISRHHANMSARSDARDVDGRDCIRAPAVGAYATFVVFAWRDRDEYTIPAATVAHIDRINRGARVQAVP